MGNGQSDSSDIQKPASVSTDNNNVTIKKTSSSDKFDALLARRSSRVSQSIDATILPPRNGEVDQWIESIKVMSRRPGGVPDDLRRKV